MALSQPATAALVLAAPGLLAFLFAVLAENKKPSDPSEAPRLKYDQLSDRTTCNYPQDPTIALGISSVVFLFISTVLSLIALYYPYGGKKVSLSILWRNTTLAVFTILSLVLFLVAEGLLVWAISVEIHHRKRNIHGGQLEECPTAKTGLFGGAGFLALDATLFFLIALMLTSNAREDYLMEDYEEDDKGSYGDVTIYSQEPAVQELQVA